MKPRVLLRQELNMPITPNEVAVMRNESTVNKLCALIDKRLEQFGESECVEFVFHPGTGSQIEQIVLETYRQAGWNVSLDYSENKLVFGNCAESTPTQDKPVCSELEESKLADVLEAVSRQVTYMSIARKVLMVDMLEDDTVDSYLVEDNPAQSLCINNRHEVVEYKGVDQNQLVHLHGYGKIDCKGGKIAEGLVTQEEQLLVKLLQAAGKHEQTIYTYSDTLNRAILDSMASLENDGLFSAKMIMNPFTYRRVMYLDYVQGRFDEATNRDILMTGLHGHLYTMDVHICKSIPVDYVFILPPAQYLGMFTVPKTTGFKVSVDEEVVDGLYTRPRLLGETDSYQTMVYPQNVRKIAIRW